MRLFRLFIFTLIVTLSSTAMADLTSGSTGGGSSSGGSGGSSGESSSSDGKDLRCHGRFANPLTDLCWSCIFPISMGGTPLYTGDQEDNSNPSQLFCSCAIPRIYLGVQTGFWEPARRVDVTRTPYCMVSLGTTMDMGGQVPEGEVRLHDDDDRHSFWQAHWYSDPILYWLEVIYEHPCTETGKFDISYMTEIDPLWNDDELTVILAPETNLFSNPVAQAACAGDCVLASIHFGSNLLFWCAGCNGSIYPLNGRVGAHVSHIQASSLVAQRLAAKMHRQFITWGTNGTPGLCGVYPQPLMDKSAYKYSMLYPIPQTAKIFGKCCQPFGRTTAVWGAGRSFPVKGEDFSYELFRKKNCCLGPISPFYVY